MSENPHDPHQVDVIPEAEIVGQPAAPAALEPAPCRGCPTGKATPPALLCGACEARRRAMAAALAKPAAPAPPAAPIRNGTARLATMPKPDGTTGTAKPRVSVPLTTQSGAPHLCCQCKRQYGLSPDPDDTTVRCGACLRQNRADLKAFSQRHN